jgi:hypothetical protein
MRLLSAVIATALVAGATAGASAQDIQRRPVQAGPGSTTIISKDATGRVRTKVLVQKRSYLDGGTEVIPGDVQGQQTNFVQSNQTPTSVISNDSVVPLHAIPDPSYLMGRDNPYYR